VVPAMMELRRRLPRAARCRSEAAPIHRAAGAGKEEASFRRLLSLYLGEDTRLLSFLGPPGTVMTIR